MAAARPENKVVLVDFWTYTCINCIRTLPYVKAWDPSTATGADDRRRPRARVPVREGDVGNVERAIDDNDIEYPVVQDNELGTWDAFHNQYWPAKYLIDADGQVRYVHFGEGDYEETEAAIRSLLAEAGSRRPRQGRGGDRRRDRRSRTCARPETYLGWARAQGFATAAAPRARTPTAPRRATRPSTLFALDGTLDVDEESATAVSTTRRSSSASRHGACSWCWAPRRPRASVEVLLDGKPIPDALTPARTSRTASATVTDQRLYRLVDLRRGGRPHARAALRARACRGYAFTFG